jgi:hypothetical protein
MQTRGAGGKGAARCLDRMRGRLSLARDAGILAP